MSTLHKIELTKPPPRDELAKTREKKKPRAKKMNERAGLGNVKPTRKLALLTFGLIIQPVEAICWLALSCSLAAVAASQTGWST